ncbi:hypothetical protein SUGI_0916180 [Cryptomeria japonica]|nr:hypothetical protein SUGI_0916180 [Cryptomeria japonica]
MAYREKANRSLYVFLVLFLLLTTRFAFASASDGESESESDESHLDYRQGSTDDNHPGYCNSLSGGFHGECVLWRGGECNSVCKNVDHQEFGECHEDQFTTVCYCYHKC